MSKVKRGLQSYRIYAVERPNTRWAYWKDIGMAFTHKDGKGFDLQLQSMPLGAAELVVRTSAEKRLSDGSIAATAQRRRRLPRRARPSRMRPRKPSAVIQPYMQHSA